MVGGTYNPSYSSSLASLLTRWPDITHMPPIIAVTRNPQTASQAHLYCGIFPVLCKDPVQEARAEDVDRWVNLALNVGKARGFFKKGDVGRARWLTPVIPALWEA